MILSAMFAATMMLADTTPAAAAAASSVNPATAAAPANPAAPAKASKPRVICKTESVTGSLMPKKTCYTTDDYAQRQQDERQNLERMQNNLALKGN
jgi:hypothetical protein